MNVHAPYVPEEIDRLVRAALEADAREVNLAALEQSIRDRLDPQRPRTLRFQKRRILSYSALAAACIVLLAALGNHLLLSPTTASAYSLVSTASSALNSVQDHCYRIDEFHMPAAWLRAVPLLHGAEITTLWSRGDRFRAATTRQGKSTIWGQDEQGRLWCAVDGKHALRYEQDELPPRMLDVVTYLKLDLRKLMTELLSDYQLETESAGDEVVVIHARYRGKLQKPHQFNSVRLEMERGTSLIRRMELSRKMGANEVARFAFVLVNEQPQADEFYQLQGNVEPDAVVYDRTQRGKRIRLYKGLLNN